MQLRDDAERLHMKVGDAERELAEAEHMAQAVTSQRAELDADVPAVPRSAIAAARAQVEALLQQAG